MYALQEKKSIKKAKKVHKIVFQMFHLNKIKLIENYGTGIPRTINAYKRHFVKPKFLELENFFIVKSKNLDFDEFFLLIFQNAIQNEGRSFLCKDFLSLVLL